MLFLLGVPELDPMTDRHTIVTWALGALTWALGMLTWGLRVLTWAVRVLPWALEALTWVPGGVGIEGNSSHP